MISSEVSNSTATVGCLASQAKVQNNPCPWNTDIDDVSNVPLLKKMFRRKLSGCFTQMNVGAYRPKPTSTNEEQDEDLGVSGMKKQRISINTEETQKYAIELSESVDETENTSPTEKVEKGKRKNDNAWPRNRS